MATLTINGVEHTVDAPAEMPLLWVLRDLLDLRGAKYACGEGLCGACTVHLGGTPVRSCVMPLAAVDGKSITTVEGLDAHVVQQAWEELNVPQCGYCQSGQIMAAAALLAEHPDPTDAQIDAAMGGVLCRCGTYPRIRAAIHRAAKLAGGAS